jgi:hypothetical protein
MDMESWQFYNENGQQNYNVYNNDFAYTCFGFLNSKVLSNAKFNDTIFLEYFHFFKIKFE